MHVNTKTIKSTNVRVLRRGCRFASVLINCRFIWFQFLFSSSSFLLSYSVVWHEQLTLGDSQNQSSLLPLMYIGRRGLLVQITFEVTGKSRNTTCRAVSCACMGKKKQKTIILWHFYAVCMTEIKPLKLPISPRINPGKSTKKQGVLPKSNCDVFACVTTWHQSVRSLCDQMSRISTAYQSYCNEVGSGTTFLCQLQKGNRNIQTICPGVEKKMVNI